MRQVPRPRRLAPAPPARPSGEARNVGKHEHFYPNPHGRWPVLVTLSLVSLLGVTVWVLHRFAGLKFWHAVVCVLFGFFLAGTSLAPTIRRAISNAIAYLSGHGR